MIIHDVEQNTDAWYALRIGLPTASNFKKLVTTKGVQSKSLKPYANKLGCDKYANKDTDEWEGNKYTARGHEVEPEARAAYAFSATHPVDTVGFITDDLFLWGCSPDSLVGDDGLLEIKCLPKLHYAALEYIRENDRPPPDYLVQCQGQLAVTGRKWVDLYYYHPDLPSKAVRIYPDPVIQKALIAARAAVHLEIKKTINILESY